MNLRDDGGREPEGARRLFVPTLAGAYDHRVVVPSQVAVVAAGDSMRQAVGGAVVKRGIVQPAGSVGRLRSLALCAVGLFMAAGCVPATVPSDGGDTSSDTVDGNRDGTVTSSSGKTFGEPNDDFDQAVIAVFDENGDAELKGSVPQRGDLDVYRLGPLSAGDRLIVDMSTVGSALDVSIAVFDSQRRLMVNNDDRTPENLDSLIDWVVRDDGSEYYLVVTTAAFAASGTFTGSYAADISVIGGSQVPAPREQVVVLDFDGGQVNSPVLGSLNLGPFDAAEIDSRYAGTTDDMIARIREVMEQNYERFNVTVLTTDDEPPPAGTEVSRIFFGGFNAGAYGIAEDVDLYNVDLCDDAIIYTESFTTNQFSRPPSASSMGLAIGNVAAHETGHLLGLNHVDNDADLMDDRSMADAFLTDQEFMESPLSSDIMPIGTQDGVLLLSDSVGLIED